jgi:hypothetical protein
MELANQIFFIAFALIGLGLFLSALYQYRANKTSGFSIYWPLSVGIFSLSSLSFGIALWTHKFFLTIANTSFIEAARNNINKTISVASKSINAPINQSLNSTGNAGENGANPVKFNNKGSLLKVNFSADFKYKYSLDESKK